MSFGDLLWLFFIFIMLQPRLRQRMLEWERATCAASKRSGTRA
jgi:hypothetical protein